MNRILLCMDRKGMFVIVFVMEKFNDFMFGRKRVVFSNYKLLKLIFKKFLYCVFKCLKGMVNLFMKV